MVGSDGERLFQYLLSRQFQKKANAIYLEPAVTQLLDKLGDTLPIIIKRSQDRDLLITQLSQQTIELGGAVKVIHE